MELRSLTWSDQAKPLLFEGLGLSAKERCYLA
jgi:hypothetical protein